MRSGGVAWLVGVVSALAVAVSLTAQQNPPAEAEAAFASILAAAREAFASRDLDRSAAEYQKLLVAARAANSRLWEGRATLGFGRVANEAARYADGRRYALEALAIFESLNAKGDIGAANMTLGVTAETLNDNTLAKMHYERAATAYQEAGNERARLTARFRWLGLVAEDGGGLETFGELQAEAHAAGYTALEADILHSWGDQLYARADYKLALEKLEVAAALFQKTDSLEDLGTTYNSLGRLYRAHGQPAAALEFQLKALAIHQTINEPRQLIQSLNAVAVAFQMLGNDDQARTYFEQALAAAQRTGVGSYVNFVTANLGALLVETDKDVERGRDLLERVVAADDSSGVSTHLTQLASAYLKLGRHRESLAAAGRALELCRAPLECVDARAADARAQLALGHEAAALADETAILAAVEKVHATLAPSDLLKQGFQRFWEEAYSVAIDLHFRRGEFREALEASELGRSRAFLDLLASRELKRPQPDRPEPSLKTNALRSDASASAPTVDDLTAIAVRLRSTLLAYWVGLNKVYVWVLTPDGQVRGASVPMSRAKLDELIKSIAPFTQPRAPSPTGMIATRGEQHIAVSERSHRPWRALYDLLIAPVERELPRANGSRLTIVPYGPLLGVPFAALRDARGRYLIERYTIHSVPAGAVLQYTAGKVRDDSRAGAVLLVGDPARLPRIPGEPPLPRLAGARDEVQAIAHLLPASRTTMLTGSAATELRVVSALSGKTVVHLATHGIIRDGNPLSSFLALGAAGDRSADGQLTIDQIYGLDLDAGLVVLSACRSGGGVITGDGIAGLARAFFYAGTTSVIVSVWDVADQPTNRLLPAFYRHWLNGADKASALRAAQLSLIRSLRAGQIKVRLSAGTFVLPEDPAFWATFVLLGEPD